jgi:hypothetical protein
MVALIGLVVVHELLHPVSLPGCGLTSATIAGVWPQKLTPYVFYEGELSRNRHILVDLMPFLLLSVVPLFAGLLFAWMPPWLVLLSAINTFASSGDFIASALLVWQTPSSACAGYIAHPSEYLGNGDAMSLKIGYYAGQS